MQVGDLVLIREGQLKGQTGDVEALVDGRATVRVKGLPWPFDETLLEVVPAFSGLGPATPMQFQGGVIFVKGYGCKACGLGFWTEDDPTRRLQPGAHTCPHCGALGKIPED